MKKPILTFLICIIFGFSLFTNKHDAFQGSWISNSVVYSFQNDSLYVDEINNEGDVYMTTDALADIIRNRRIALGYSQDMVADFCDIPCAPHFFDCFPRSKIMISCKLHTIKRVGFKDSLHIC